MKKGWLVAGLGAVALVLLGASAKKTPERKLDAIEKQYELIVSEYVNKMLGLVVEYANNKDFARARWVLGQVKPLAPEDPRIKTLADQLDEAESKLNRRQFRFDVNQDWYDTGCKLIKGHRVYLSVKGQWVLQLAERVGPEGLAMDKQTEKFRLGAVLGRIGQKGPAFLVGAGGDIVATESDNLYLKVNVDNPGACKGFLTCVIAGTYQEADR